MSRIDWEACNDGFVTESATEGGAPAQALVIVDAKTGFLEGEKAVVEAAQLTTRLGREAVVAALADDLLLFGGGQVQLPAGLSMLVEPRQLPRRSANE